MKCNPLPGGFKPAVYAVLIFLLLAALKAIPDSP